MSEATLVYVTQEQRDLLSLLPEIAKIIEYVSRGRGYVGVEPYPDAAARRLNALLKAKTPSEEGA